MLPSLVPEASFPGTTRQDDRIREPVIPTRDAYLRPKSQSTTVYHTETKPRSGHYGSRPGPGHHCRVFCRQQEQTLMARVSLHIQKPKPQASMKNKIEKIYKLFDVYNLTMKFINEKHIAISIIVLMKIHSTTYKIQQLETSS